MVPLRFVQKQKLTVKYINDPTLRVEYSYNKNILLYEHTNTFIIVYPLSKRHISSVAFLNLKIKFLPIHLFRSFSSSFELTSNVCIALHLGLNESFQGHLNLQTRKRTYFV